MSYQHSQAFAKLKSLNESIDVNLTSGQYLSILDTLLLKAVEPLVLTTNSFDGFVARLMGWQEINTKRKVSLLERADFAPIATSWLLLPTRAAKAAHVKRLKLDRASLFEFVYTFLDVTADYVSACNASLKIRGHYYSLEECLAYKLETEKALASDSSLIAAISTARHWIDEASKFKTRILEKYIRLCLTAAKSDYQTVFDTNVPLDDLVQTYILAASRAIDKCDARQGALTTHIRYWFYTARSSVTKTTEGQQDGALSEDLESEDVPLSTALEARQANDGLRLLASLIDPLGAGRAYLGICEATDNIVNESSKYTSLVNSQRLLNEASRKTLADRTP